MAEPDGDTLETLGEAGVLARIFPRLPAAASELLGPGDDAAVLAAPDGRFVVTTDTLVHGPDFRFAWSTPEDLGWKSAAVNLADVAAMGAVPSGLVVALAAPASTPVAVLEGIADGFRGACEALAPGCGVVGGDLAVSDTFVVAVTAFGDLEGRAPVRRSGARIGDVVALAGELGRAARGLELLFSEATDAAGEPDAELAIAARAAHPDIAAQLRPSPPVAAGRAAAAAGATSMIDISDGLALDARRVARASGVALDLEPGAIGSRLALVGGEDHALLATFPPSAGLPEGFHAFGRVVAGEGLLLAGASFDERGGWDPYADWDGNRG